MKSLIPCVCFFTAFSALAAEPSITIEARQRYPWNGLVDLQFTITGTSGTKYDTSFTATDMMGNTNIAMRTIRKSDGSAANVAKELLLPGTYNWVWDAAADLPKNWKCDRVTVTGTATPSDTHKGVQLWAGGPCWAETNIGAQDPWDYGLYFWWGDTIGYKRANEKWVASDGSSSNFSFGYTDTPTYDKNASTLVSEGWVTADGVLAPAHDAAQAHWGGSWRMPTYNELCALDSKCDWTWTTRNGVKGYVVRGRGNYSEASIFLPATGFGSWTSLVSANSLGCYWSSVPYSDLTNAYEFYFDNVSHGAYDYYRSSGRSVRPVMNATTGE